MCLASYFLNFGVEPQNTVGSKQDLRTDYSKMKKSWYTTISNLMKLMMRSPKGLKTLWKKEKLRRKTSVFKYLYCRNVKTKVCLGKSFRFVGVIVKKQSRRW